jgi:hypothetical protein
MYSIPRARRFRYIREAFCSPIKQMVELHCLNFCLIRRVKKNLVLVDLLFQNNTSSQFFRKNVRQNKDTKMVLYSVSIAIFLRSRWCLMFCDVSLPWGTVFLSINL